MRYRTRSRRIDFRGDLYAFKSVNCHRLTARRAASSSVGVGHWSNVDRRKYCQLVRPIAQSVSVWQTTLTALAWRDFPILGQIFRWKYPYSSRYPNFIKHSVVYIEGSLCIKNQLDLFIIFDRTPACDGLTQ